MKCNGTEIAPAEAAAVVSYGKPHLLDSGNTSGAFVHRVVCPHIRERIDRIQLLAGDAQLQTVVVVLFEVDQ